MQIAVMLLSCLSLMSPPIPHYPLDAAGSQDKEGWDIVRLANSLKKGERLVDLAVKLRKDGTWRNCQSI